ncbi:Ig-like domain-containing protein [Patescibacteria group bacterium]
MSRKKIKFKSEQPMTLGKVLQILITPFIFLVVGFAVFTIVSVDSLQEYVSQGYEDVTEEKLEYKEIVQFNNPRNISYDKATLEMAGNGIRFVKKTGFEDVILLDGIAVEENYSLVGFSDSKKIDKKSSIEYQVSSDPQRWYYYNGSSWADASGCEHCTSTVDEINSNIADLPAVSNNLRVKARIRNNGGSPILRSASFHIEGARKEYSSEQLALRSEFTKYSTSISAEEACPCNSGMTSLTAEFVGASGSDVNVYLEDGHRTLIKSFTNVQNGDILTVQSSEIGETKFKTRTYFETVGSPDVDIHTSCSQDIWGLTFGDFKIIGFTDGEGRICDGPPEPPCPCEGDLVSLTVQYTGPSGVDINVYYDKKEPQDLLGTFTNVQTGDTITVNASAAGQAKLRGETKFVIDGSETKVKSKCDDIEEGSVFGNYTIIGWEDQNGSICGGVVELVPPVAVDDAETTNVDIPVDVDVLANDSDSDGWLIMSSVNVTSNPTNGSTNVNATSGVITYTPNSGYTGSDTFEYEVCDNDGLCDTAIVTITISTSGGQCEGCDGPCNGPDSTSWVDSGSAGSENCNEDTLHIRAKDNGDVRRTYLHFDSTPTPVPGQVINLRIDADAKAPATVGVYEVTWDGTCVNWDNAPAVGALITTTVIDADGYAYFDITSVSGGTLDIVLKMENETLPPGVSEEHIDFTDPCICGKTCGECVPPDAEDDSSETDHNTPVTIDVLVNDVFNLGDLDPSTVTVISGPSNGTTDVNPNTGEITYTPAEGFCGIDTFEYEVCGDWDENHGFCGEGGSGSNACDTATVTVQVNCPPIAVDDEDVTEPATPVTTDVLDNDYDIDGTLVPSTVTEVTPPGNGSTSVNPSNGEITYTPDAGFLGTDTYEYEVCDNDGLCDIALVTIRINIPPEAIDDCKMTPMNTPVDIDILANDTDDDGVIVPSTTNVTSPPTDGSVVINPATGVATYTPDTGYYGQDTFTYEVCDDDGGCDTADVLIVINHPPIARDDEEETELDEPVDVVVLNNDEDPDGTLDPTTVEVISGPFNGTVDIDPVTGVITYTPNAGFFGTDSFVYRVCEKETGGGSSGGGEEDDDDYCEIHYNDDPGGDDDTEDELCDTATVTITILSPPIANDDSESTDENEPVDIDLLDNDFDLDGVLVPNTTTVTSPPSDGDVTINPTDGVATYTPDPGFTGPTDTFDYEVCDNDDLCATATVTITINANAPPEANDDHDTTELDTPVTVDILVNDSDPDGQIVPSTTNVTRQPDNGNVTINPTNGEATYTPDPGYYGTDTFDYEVCDNDGLCDDATVYISILHPPIAVDDEDSTEMETPVTVDVLDNDSDPDGFLVPSTVTETSPPSYGVTSVNSGNGTIKYTPEPGYYGIDSFEYEVCDNDDLCDTATVTITILSPPIAENDEDSTEINVPVDIDILDNDSDLDGFLLPATVNLVDAPDNGSVTFNPTDGVATYIPAPNYYGTDTFEYEVCDNDGLCDEALVTINILSPPIAEDDSETTPPDTPVTVVVLNNDSDPDGTLIPSTVTVLDFPTNGNVLVNNTTGEITYTPNPGYSGLDTFRYKVCDNDGLCDDAIVTITVLQPPIAVDDEDTTEKETPVTVDVLVNDSDPDGTLVPSTVTETRPPSFGSTSINPGNGEITYTPDPGYFGIDTFDYEVCDNDGLCDEATVTITILSPPIAANDSESTDENTPVTIDILDNDIDLDGVLEPSTVQVLTGPSNGNVTVNTSTGEATYTPDPGFTGPTDVFTYEVCDNDGLCDDAEVVITINENAPPEANDDQETTEIDVPVDVDLLVNDSDPDGTLVPSTTTETVPPSNGTVSINPTDGVATYTPDPGFFGVDVFEYEVCDDDGACDDATVTITIMSPPTAEDDSETTLLNIPVLVDILDNDYDLDGVIDPSTVTIIGGPSNGSLGINTSTGEVTYTPNTGYYGTDTFDYQVCDDDGLCDAAIVTITVLSPPDAVDDTATTTIGTPVVIPNLDNDSDPDGTIDPGTVIIIIDPPNGTVTIDPGTDTVTYTPDPGFAGVDTFTYLVCDNDGLCDTAVVTVTIGDLPPPPPPPPVVPPAAVVPVAPAVAPPPAIIEGVIFGANQFILDNQSAPLAMNGVVQFTVNEAQTFYIEAKGASTMEVRNIDTNDIYPLAYDEDLKLWTGLLYFDEAGFYRLEATAVSEGEGITYTREINSVVVAEREGVSDVETGDSINNAVIRVFEKDIDTGNFNEWNGVAFGQQNPFPVLANGDFSIVLPEGEFYLEIEAPGYRTIKSLITNIEEQSFVTASITMEKEGTFIDRVVEPFVVNGSDNFPLTVTAIPEHSLLEIGEVVPEILVYEEDPANPYSLFDVIAPKNTVLFQYGTWDTLADEQIEIYDVLIDRLGDKYQFVPLSTMEPDGVVTTYRDRGEYDIVYFKPFDVFHDDYFSISLPHFYLLNGDRELVGQIVAPHSLDELVEGIDDIFGETE